LWEVGTGEGGREGVVDRHIYFICFTSLVRNLSLILSLLFSATTSHPHSFLTPSLPPSLPPSPQHGTTPPPPFSSPGECVATLVLLGSVLLRLPSLSPLCLP
jgi:hypothetical protein